MKHINYHSYSIMVLVMMISLNGCSDEVTINQISENRPPQILLSGPEYDVTEPIEGPLPGLWVIAGDEDGAEDIAAVVLRISSIKLTNLIVRPDDASEECRRPFYADMDTINIMPFLIKNTFTVSALPLSRGTAGTYSAYLTYYLLTEGGIEQYSNYFGENVKSCRWARDYLYMIENFGLYPPALSQPRDVYVTYAEFLIGGISITVYDQAGETATETFPDFRGYFTNFLEEETLP